MGTRMAGSFFGFRQARESILQKIDANQYQAPFPKSEMKWRVRVYVHVAKVEVDWWFLTNVDLS